ncbi:MAG: diaminopimelate epimerase [Chloroflexi bacterium]|nr:diaminopimelate epimerase [Chloroflexota bacterium]
MEFTKVQGAGNDFVLVEPGDNERNWSQLAQAICDRHFGVGADGLLLVLPSKVADFRMRVFNVDGSEADACGNGLRCLVRYVLERKLAKDRARHLSIETLSGTRQVKLGSGKKPAIQVTMGGPKFGPKEVPVAVTHGSPLDITPILDHPVNVDGQQLLLDFVAIGNPHTVHFTQQPVAEFPLAQLGPKVEHHKIFPRRANFEVARVINRQEIDVRVWERGVGETLACGSGACAVAVLAQLHGYIDHKVDIKLPGGVLGVEWAGKGEVFLSGPAEIVYTGQWPE